MNFLPANPPYGDLALYGLFYVFTADGWQPFRPDSLLHHMIVTVGIIFEGIRRGE